MDGTLNTTGTDGTRIVFWHRELPPRLEWRPAQPAPQENYRMS